MQNALNTANQILNRDAEKKKQAEEEQSRVVDSVKLVSDFYGDVTEKLGAKNASLAKELAESAKGKKFETSMKRWPLSKNIRAPSTVNSACRIVKLTQKLSSQ